MPNYVRNKVKITHTDVARVEQLKVHYDNNNLFESVLPVPEGLLGTVLGVFKDADKQAEVDKRLADNYEKYGYNSDHSWRVDNWGTKWSTIDRQPAILNGNELLLEFNTAWSPPTGILNELRKQGFEVDSEWDEDY